MHKPVIASVLAATVFATSLPAMPRTALAQQAEKAASPAAAAATPAAPATPPTASAAPATAAPAASPPAAVAAELPPLDQSQLPPLPPIVPTAEKNRMVLLATGAGAAIGVIVVDIVTGGLLLAPLGIPSASGLLTVGGGGAAAVAAPTYSIAQRVLAGVATIASAAGGGYLGAYVGRTRPDFVRLGD